MVETRSTGVGQYREPARPGAAANGRQVTDLLLLSPGVTVNTAGGFSSNRNYPTMPIRWRADRRAAPSTYGRRQPQRSRHQLQPAVPFPDALQEFRVETSALAARYGNHAAAVVNVVTKSGTNQ